jgi:hypothetical protein
MSEPIYSFQLHYGPGVDSHSNRNEYQGSSSEGKAQPMLEADNLTVICEPTVYKMRDLRRLTTLGAPTACYGDSFTVIYVDVRTSQETRLWVSTAC